MRRSFKVLAGALAAALLVASACGADQSAVDDAAADAAAARADASSNAAAISGAQAAADAAAADAGAAGAQADAALAAAEAAQAAADLAQATAEGNQAAVAAAESALADAQNAAAAAQAEASAARSEAEAAQAEAASAQEEAAAAQAEAAAAQAEAAAAQGEAAEAQAAAMAAEEALEAETAMARWNVGVAHAPSFNNLVIDVAYHRGIYAKHGLDAELVGIRSGPEMAAALLSGQANFAHNVPTNILALVDQGADVKVFHTSIREQFFDIIISAAVDLPSDDPEDWAEIMQSLEGATVGVVARNAAAEDVARVLYESAGVDQEANTYVATGLSPTTLAAMEAGEIDWAMAFEPSMTIALNTGLAVAPFSLRDRQGPSSLHWPGTLVMTTGKFAAENPGALSAYRRSMDEAVEYVRDPANREDVLDILVELLGGMDRDLAALMFDNNVDYISADGVVDVAALDSVAEIAAGVGKIKEAYPALRYVINVPK